MIRDAKKTDVEAIVELAKVMHGESKFAVYDFDPIKLGDLISALCESKSGIVLVAEVEGQVAGAFVGYVTTHFFGNDKVSGDYGTFVLPEHRGGFLGAELILEYVKQAKARGAAEVTIANSTGYQPEKVAALFKKLGFSQHGFVFSMGAKQ